jgi:hypothetical protein
MLLQEGLEDREAVKQDLDLAIRHSQEDQDRFSEDLELAIAGWKRAINAEVAKAKNQAPKGWTMSQSGAQILTRIMKTSVSPLASLDSLYHTS